MKIISFKTYSLLVESFKDAQKKWISVGNDEEDVINTINQFKRLKLEFKIKDVEKSDIGYWMKKSFYDFVHFVNNILEEENRQQELFGKERDVIKIEETEDVLIVVPKTWEASKKYGKDTKWCLTYSNSDSYWNSYVHEEGLTPYYIIFKPKAIKNDIRIEENDLEKIAVMVSNYDDIDSIWDSTDNSIRLNQQIKEWDNEFEGWYFSDVTVDDFLSGYNIDVSDFNSMLYEDGGGYDEEWIEEFFEEKEDDIQEEFDDLNSFYIKNKIDKFHQVTKDVLIDFYTVMFGEGKIDVESGSYGSIINDLSDYVKRTIPYQESKYIDEIDRQFYDYIQYKFDNHKVRYEFN